MENRERSRKRRRQAELGDSDRDVDDSAVNYGGYLHPETMPQLLPSMQAETEQVSFHSQNPYSFTLWNPNFPPNFSIGLPPPYLHQHGMPSPFVPFYFTDTRSQVGSSTQEEQDFMQHYSQQQHQHQYNQQQPQVHLSRESHSFSNDPDSIVGIDADAPETPPAMGNVNAGKRSHRSSRLYSSEYRGVYWHKHSKAWRARIWVDGKSEHLGLFDSEEMAARAFDRRALELKRFKALNFPPTEYSQGCTKKRKTEEDQSPLSPAPFLQDEN